MTEFFSLTDVFKEIKVGEFVFAEEKSTFNSKQSFLVGAHLDLIVCLENKKPTPRLHELIFVDRPIKPFLDLESCTLSALEFEKEVNHILSLLIEEWGDPIIFSCSRESKHSLHVIFWQTVSQNVYCVKKRVAQIKSDIIDMQVYRQGTLRLPFCTSFRASPHVFYLMDWKTKQITQDYDRELLKKGMLHYFESFGIQHHVENKKSKFGTKIFAESTSCYDELLYQWAFNNCYVPLSYKENLEVGEIKLLLKNVSCPRIGHPHKSNNFYLQIDLNHASFPSCFGCLDMDCKHVRFAGPMFSTILKKEEMQKQLLTMMSLIFV